MQKDEAARREQILALEQQGAKAAAGWLGHPSLPGLTTSWRSRAEEVVAPIADQLTSQIRTLHFLFYVCGLGLLRSDLSVDPAVRWYLRPEQVDRMPPIREAFADLLAAAAADFKQSGVPLDPGWSGDLVVVGELLLLAVDFELPVEELVKVLQPLPPAAIAPNARGTSVRRGTNSRAERTITQLRSSYEDRLEGPRVRAPYAGGNQRAVPAPTRARRDALRTVLDAFPDATVSRILMTFDSPIAPAISGIPRTPGAYLRQLLRDACGTEPDRPSQTTLYADVTAINANPGEEATENPSG
ncbi:hypothetical protein [Kitasatospora sp. NPDC057500]|uniref:hypothetical protein n=1 Tax=Kitasatospora sp. NPDC057500 TaxID=3346151 RepID=UPI003692E708